MQLPRASRLSYTNSDLDAPVSRHTKKNPALCAVAATQQTRCRCSKKYNARLSQTANVEYNLQDIASPQTVYPPPRTSLVMCQPGYP